MCTPEFSIAALEPYFHPLTPRGADEKVDKVSACLIIASYFTVIIPLVCGIVYACSACSNSLQGRVTHLLEGPNTAAEHRVLANTIAASESSSAQSAPLLTYRQLHEELEAWVALEGLHAREAADRIERAYRDGLTELDLSRLGLITLPPAIGQLLRLQRLNLSANQLTTLPAAISQLLQLQGLNLSANQLTTLPDAIGQLLQLQWLNLSANRLTTLPDAIGQLLQLHTFFLSSNQLTTLPDAIGQCLRLQRLNLSSNRLTTLPAAIGQLLRLQRLNLSSNQLTTLPAAIGQLLQLRRLELRGNLALFEMPVAFSNLLNITYLDISGTSIPPAQLDLVLATIRRQRDAGAVARLPSKLNLWKDYAETPDLNLDISVLDPAQKQLLHEWLVRLERVRDFQRSQQSLCKTACRILSTVLEDGTFRESFFVQVRDNLVACGDRAAMSFNEIYTAWVLATLPPEETIHRKLEILIGVAKTNALRNCLQQIIDIRERETGLLEQENVEIYLYYESTLRERLSLVSAIQHMLYATIGQREWIDVSHLTRQVMESYPDILIEIPAFDALIKQDQAFMDPWARVEDRFQEQLESVPKDVTSEEYLTRTTQIQEARNQEWKIAAIRWAEASLRPVRQ